MEHLSAMPCHLISSRPSLILSGEAMWLRFSSKINKNSAPFGLIKLSLPFLISSLLSLFSLVPAQQRQRQRRRRDEMRNLIVDKLLVNLSISTDEPVL